MLSRTSICNLSSGVKPVHGFYSVRAHVVGNAVNNLESGVGLKSVPGQKEEEFGPDDEVPRFRSDSTSQKKGVKDSAQLRC